MGNMEALIVLSADDGSAKTDFWTVDAIRMAYTNLGIRCANHVWTVI